MNLNHVVALVLYVTFLAQCKCYYLSAHQLTQDRAEWYCVSVCDSHLASIHSINDQILANETIQNRPIAWWGKENSGFFDGAWLGLFTPEFPGEPLTYTDDTPFDYNNDTSGGIGQWEPSEPSTTCTIMKQSGEWDSLECTRYSRPLCNECNGVINKYGVSINALTNIEEANFECNARFSDTSLASIHSERDNQEAVQIYNITQKSLWLGLTATDNKDVDTFVWSDSTPFTYGNDLNNDINCASGGPGPWFEDYPIGFPNVIMQGDFCTPIGSNGCWGLNGCISGSNYPLCKLPSEFYPPLNVWSQSPNNSWIINGTSKTYTQRYDTLNVAGVIMKNKQWYNGGQNVLIDFMYSIDFRDEIEVEMSITIYNGVSSVYVNGSPGNSGVNIIRSE